MCLSAILIQSRMKKEAEKPGVDSWRRLLKENDRFSFDKRENYPGWLLFSWADMMLLNLPENFNVRRVKLRN